MRRPTTDRPNRALFSNLLVCYSLALPLGHFEAPPVPTEPRRPLMDGRRSEGASTIMASAPWSLLVDYSSTTSPFTHSAADTLPPPPGFTSLPRPRQNHHLLIRSTYRLHCPKGETTGGLPSCPSVDTLWVVESHPSHPHPLAGFYVP